MARSQSGTAEEPAEKCAKCGRTFGNAGARAKHEGTCEGGSDAEPESDEIDPQSVDIDTIPKRIRAASDAQLRATVDTLGGDTDAAHLHDEAARRILKAKHDGTPDREAYTTVFDVCEKPSCDHGRYGFATAYCRKHTPDSYWESDESESDSGENGTSGSGDTPERTTAPTGSPERWADTERSPGRWADESRESDTPESGDGQAEDARADYVARLIANGTEPAQAEQAASARFD
jgi:hypothetical protein